MSSTRPKLKLDEQSFQGLLAAAFTIQDHNDRRKLQIVAPTPAETAPPVPDPNFCRQCGTPLAAGTPCSSCGSEELRPGERLQRNWASMWLKSQEQGIWPSRGPAELEESDALSNSSDGGRDGGNSYSATSPSKIRHFPSSPFPDTGDQGRQMFSVRGHAPESPATHESGRTSLQTEIDWPDGEAQPSRVPDALAVPLVFSNDAIVEGSEEVVDPSNDYDLASTDETVPESAGMEGAPAGDRPLSLRNLRVTVRFQRADLYLGLAVLVAVLALLWPSSKPQQHSMPAWEKTLIALGVAEAQRPATHNPGDPSLKVWVDPHTALYYCPGDELYGKSRDGRYTTQHEAQAESFEPALQSACIE